VLGGNDERMYVRKKGFFSHFALPFYYSGRCSRLTLLLPINTAAVLSSHKVGKEYWKKLKE
jgi:hypothetical protein